MATRTLAEGLEIPTTGQEPNDGTDRADEREETAAGARQLAARDAEAFKHLFDTYFDRLYRYAYRYLQSAEESQDLVHDVFLQIWRQRRRVGLEQDLRAYLYATTRNQALNRLKHRKVELRFLERRAAAMAAEEGTGPTSNPEQEMEEVERAAALQRAIDTLPRRQREVLQLRWQNQLSYAEVAALLHISPKTVAVHLARAFEHLRRALPRFFE
jgi:RNA polymerase sigma-70 factor (ECF subfamily)